MPTPLLLLIEDSEDDAFFFRRTFQKTGVELDIHHVLNGTLAVEFLQNAVKSGRLPVLIFMDLKMPIMNGFDVLAWMQQQSFCSNIPVVVLSGSDHQKDKQRVNELGAVGYLVKPATGPDLQRLLQTFAKNSGISALSGKGASA